MHKIKFRPRKPIKDWREDRGWSQAQVAKRIGVSRSHYSNLENGWRAIPAHLINRIAKALAYRVARD
jgi:transcriptional regulator with XRE-family HTH domain